MSCDLDLCPFHLKIGTLLTRALGTSVPILIFLRFLVFELVTPKGQTDGQTNKQTDTQTDGQDA